MLSDWGSENVNEETEQYIRDREIVHLWSPPHTPQNISVVECTSRELKSVLGMEPKCGELVLGLEV